MSKIWGMGVSGGFSKAISGLVQMSTLNYSTMLTRVLIVKGEMEY